ncbi:hypothetical protein FACS189421_03070 [Bacteroidia bacterium]|nr:hypothetical protein FACS189421_03070 [Bacteroidia bacterium]
MKQTLKYTFVKIALVLALTPVAAAAQDSGAPSNDSVSAPIADAPYSLEYGYPTGSNLLISLHPDGAIKWVKTGGLSYENIKVSGRGHFSQREDLHIFLTDFWEPYRDTLNIVLKQDAREFYESQMLITKTIVYNYIKKHPGKLPNADKFDKTFTAELWRRRLAINESGRLVARPRRAK